MKRTLYTLLLTLLLAISGLQTAQAGRMYDPEVSRFLSIDPILQETSPLELQKMHGGKFYSNSPYAYVFNNPVKYVDPDGKFPLAPAIPYLWAAAEIAAPYVVAGAAAVGTWLGLNEIYDQAKEYFSNEEQVAKSVTIEGTEIALPNDKTTAPGEAWEWRGKGEVGSEQGAWYNPNTKESLKNDMDHPAPVGPHWDYTDSDKSKWRVDPNTGKKTPKE
jgi:RHS repeat-associated protein